MTWFYASSVTVSNGQTVVSVNAGDDIQLAQAAGGLIIGTQPAVEIKRTFLDGSSNKKIELTKPWPYGTQTNQPAMAFPTDGDLAAATAVLKQLIDGFTLASEAEAKAGAENSKPMTALRVKQAMDALLGSASKLVATTSTTDATVGRALRVGDFGLGKALEGVSVRSIGSTSFFTGATGNQIAGGPDNGFGFGLKVAHPTQGSEYYAALYRAHDSERWFVTGTYGQGANPWQEIYHTASAVGSVAFVGGVNTGAIIERGSNSNGNFIAFADGTLICWIVFSTSPGLTQYVPGIYATSPGWTFPSGFQGGIPSVSVSGGDSANPGWASASEANATGVTLTYYTRSPAPSLVVMQAVAVGRWR